MKNKEWMTLIYSLREEMYCENIHGNRVDDDCYEIVSPGFISLTSIPGTSFCSSVGLPVSTGNVPKCIGITVFGWSIATIFRTSGCAPGSGMNPRAL